MPRLDSTRGRETPCCPRSMQCFARSFSNFFFFSTGSAHDELTDRAPRRQNNGENRPPE